MMKNRSFLETETDAAEDDNQRKRERSYSIHEIGDKVEDTFLASLQNIPNVQGQVEQVFADQDDIDEFPIWKMNDVEIIVQNIIQCSNAPQYPFAFYHQIFHYFKNRSLVQNDILELRRSKTFKLLHYGHLIQGYPSFFGSSTAQSRPESIVLLPTSFYLTTFLEFCQTKAKETDLYEKLRDLITNTDQISFSLSFLAANKLSVDDINFLQNYGYLTLRDAVLANSTSSQVIRGGIKSENVYWLSHPLVGRLLQYLTRTENRLIQLIRRKKYKEIHEKELQKSFMQSESSVEVGKKITSPLSLKFHLLDLLGRHRLLEVSSPLENGSIYRFTG